MAASNAAAPTPTTEEEEAARTRRKRSASPSTGAAATTPHRSPRQTFKLLSSHSHSNKSSTAKLTADKASINAADVADRKHSGQNGEAAPFHSQPMSKTASSSSISSAKKADELDSIVAQQPYGTRSRSRPGPRPNYTDEPDNDFEPAVATRSDATSSKRSTPSDTLPISSSSSSTRRANGDSDFTPPASSANTAAGRRASAQTSALHHLQSASHLSKSEKAVAAAISSSPPPERKKRKYERHNVKSALADSSNGHVHAQSGSTTNSTPEPHPAKKRRIAATDGSSNLAGPRKLVVSSSSASTSALSTISHGSGRISPLVTFEKSKAILQDGKLKADDGSVYAVNDNVYLICEPPGDPYYICRIMEFRRAVADDPKTPVQAILVNWFFRPRDIGRYHSDPRYLYASMQSDESPLTSLRGKCQIKHRSEITDFEKFRKGRDTFWFNQLFDRYIHRPYEIIPTSLVINVPEKVKKVLDERWKFLVVEPARQKELTSAVKLCKRCKKYCAPDNSVDCGVCRHTYHMTCVRPPLAKKPSRGFAWSCGPCSRAQEKRLEQRHTAIIGADAGTDREDEMIEDEEEEAAGMVTKAPNGSADNNTIVEEEEEEDSPSQAEIAQAQMWPWRYLGIHSKVEDVLQYDDRAIYPRASSRLGPRHQANVGVWPGQPVELIISEVKKRHWKHANANKNAPKPSKETQAAMDAEKAARANRKKWQQDAPTGYVPRGEDYANDDPKNTAQRLFLMPEEEDELASDGNPKSSEEIVDEYMAQARSFAKDAGLARKVYPGHRKTDAPPASDLLQEIMPTNFLDKALSLLMKHNYDSSAALKELRTLRGPKDFGDPDFTKEEVKKFEDGVAKHGSELRSVRKPLKSHAHGEIVRFYYNWKKTGRGQEVWGNHGSRKGTQKKAEASWTDIADDEDDSAFDNDKSFARKRRFHCKFCKTQSSRQWRRAPNVAPGATVLADPKGSAREKANQLVVALCRRCAMIWRKYALKYEDTEELAKSITQSGTRAWRRKNEEELLRELVIANEATGVHTGPHASTVAKNLGLTLTVPHPEEVAKKSKKAAAAAEQEQSATAAAAGDGLSAKKKGGAAAAAAAAAAQVQVREPSPELIPQQPKFRQLPCAVCRHTQPSGDRLVCCRSCRLTVHRKCYGISERASANRWLCDTCLNDKTGSCLYSYDCLLCPVVSREVQLVEAPKVSLKKNKSEKERDKEAKEKKLAEEMADHYRKSQDKNSRPRFPREALKRTANNNWMHIVCSVWTPDIRYLRPDKMDYAEGVSAALITSLAKTDGICKVCKSSKGLCVACHQCHASFHIGCAHEADYIFGFDIVPVKATRKDIIASVTLGSETGAMTAAIWCKEHANQIKTIVHDMNEICADTGLTALQTFVTTYKKADVGHSTGIARKANLLNLAAKQVVPLVNGSIGSSALPAAGSRRSSIITNGVTTAKSQQRASTPVTTTTTTTTTTATADGTADDSPSNGVTLHDENNDDGVGGKVCIDCGTTISLKWYPASALAPKPTLTNGGGQKKASIHPFGSILNSDASEARATRAASKQQYSSADFRCRKCHSVAQTGRELAPIFVELDHELDDSAPRPDYFEITAPRPQLLPPPPQVVKMQTGQQQQPWPPLAAQHPQQQGRPDADVAASSDENIEQWTKDLAACSVRLINPEGEFQVFRGANFSLNEDPKTIFQDVVINRAVTKLGMNVEHQIIVDDEGQEIVQPAHLMTVLVRIVQDRRLQSNWHIVEKPAVASSSEQHQHQHHQHAHYPPALPGVAFPPPAAAAATATPSQQQPPAHLYHQHSSPHQPAYPPYHAYAGPPPPPLPPQQHSPVRDYAPGHGHGVHPPPFQHQHSPTAAGPPPPQLHYQAAAAPQPLPSAAHGSPVAVVGPAPPASSHHHLPHQSAYPPTPSPQIMAQQALQQGAAVQSGAPGPGHGSGGHSRNPSAGSPTGYGVPPITTFPDVPINLAAVKREPSYYAHHPPPPPPPPPPPAGLQQQYGHAAHHHHHQQQHPHAHAHSHPVASPRYESSRPPPPPAPPQLQRPSQAAQSPALRHQTSTSPMFPPPSLSSSAATGGGPVRSPSAGSNGPSPTRQHFFAPPPPSQPPVAAASSSSSSSATAPVAATAMATQISSPMGQPAAPKHHTPNNNSAAAPSSSSSSSSSSSAAAVGTTASSSSSRSTAQPVTTASGGGVGGVSSGSNTTSMPPTTTMTMMTPTPSKATTGASQSPNLRNLMH